MLVLCARAQARAPAPRQHYPPNVLRRHVSGLQTHEHPPEGCEPKFTIHQKNQLPSTTVKNKKK